jgi:hypothetical protein
MNIIDHIMYSDNGDGYVTLRKEAFKELCDEIRRLQENEPPMIVELVKGSIIQKRVNN